MGSALDPNDLGGELEELLAEEGTRSEGQVGGSRRVRGFSGKRKTLPQSLAARLTAQRVRAVCEGTGRTREALSQQAGINDATLYRLCLGRTEPSEGTLRRLHETLDRWEAEAIAEAQASTPPILTRVLRMLEQALVQELMAFQGGVGRCDERLIDGALSPAQAIELGYLLLQLARLARPLRSPSYNGLIWHLLDHLTELLPAAGFEVPRALVDALNTTPV